MGFLFGAAQHTPVPQCLDSIGDRSGLGLTSNRYGSPCASIRMSSLEQRRRPNAVIASRARSASARRVRASTRAGRERGEVEFEHGQHLRADDAHVALATVGVRIDEDGLRKPRVQRPHALGKVRPVGCRRCKVARAVMDEVVGGPSQARPRAANLAAYQAYLKGRYHWNLSGTGGLDQAIAYSEEAVRDAPDVGAAHAALARAS